MDVLIHLQAVSRYSHFVKYSLQVLLRKEATNVSSSASKQGRIFFLEAARPCLLFQGQQCSCAYCSHASLPASAAAVQHCLSQGNPCSCRKQQTVLSLGAEKSADISRKDCSGDDAGSGDDAQGHP